MARLDTSAQICQNLDDMAKRPSAKKQRVLAKFAEPIRIEIRQPEFEPLASLALLDFKRLSKGNHKIEIGFIKGGCCPSPVRAVIKDGMVIGCEAKLCNAGKRVHPELQKLFRKAHKKAAAGKKWQPMAIADLVRSREAMQNLILTGGGCIIITIWGWGLYCCFDVHFPYIHCSFGPIIITDPLPGF
jgi:hypothetical protein